MTEARTAEPAFTLLRDEPHMGDADPLGFDEIAEDLAQLIVALRASSPFTLGIEASWGMGRSSLMRRLEARLREDKSVGPVWFNAWTADEVGELEGLIKTALIKIGSGVVRKALRNQKLMRTPCAFGRRIPHCQAESSVATRHAILLGGWCFRAGVPSDRFRRLSG